MTKQATIRSFSIPFLILVVLGCDSKPTTFIPPIPPKGPTHVIRNAEYDNWSKFPVGTKVVRRKFVENKEGKVVVTTTLKLTEKSDEKVVVESQVHVVRPDVTTDNEPQVFDFPATYEVPEDISAEQIALPDKSAKKTGEEKVTVAGKEYDATVYEWIGQLEMGKVGMKYWSSDDFPGRLMKSVVDYKMGGNDIEDSPEEIIEVVIPD